MSVRFDAAASDLVAEADGAVAGRIEWIDNLPHEAVLGPPRVETGLPAARVGRVLVDAGVRRARDGGAARVHLVLLDGRPHVAEFLAAARSWGFAHERDKHLFRAAMADALAAEIAPLPDGAEFVAPGTATDPELVATLDATLVAADARSAAEFLAECASLCRRCDAFHPEDWQVLRIGGRTAGVVLPAFADAEHVEATNLHVGLLPWARGRGVGAALTRHGMETMARRGATGYVGSTDVANAAMIRTFERLRCKRVMTQRIFVRPLR